jgi:ADP-heptose:LPS heptosyltransferase
MQGSKWENAIGSINAYVEELQKDEEIEGTVTVAAFDGNQSYGYNNQVNWTNATVRAIPTVEKNTVDFTVLRKNQNLTKFKKLKMDELSPRGGTPLYDATAQLLNMAELKPAEKTIIIIMTDGEENQSQIYNLKSIKDRLATCTNRGWEVVFLGAEFNVDNIAKNFGFASTKSVSVARSTDINDTMAFYASGATAYAKTGASLDTSAMKAKVEK